jgi:hypothetical protein
MELTDSLKKLLSETALQLKGAAKRRFMAQTVWLFVTLYAKSTDKMPR